MKKTLIVYYSISNGNTKRIANEIKKAINVDMISIETVSPYVGTYEEIVEKGKEEVERGFMPKIKDIGINISDYDTIILGTPTWWYTMAPAMLTFLKSYDFKEKTIIPFQTHGGWPGHVIKDIKNILKGANFKNEMKIQFDSEGGDKLVTKEEDINKWIEDIKKII